jgi:hypothetical protein
MVLFAHHPGQSMHIISSLTGCSHQYKVDKEEN